MNDLIEQFYTYNPYPSVNPLKKIQPMKGIIEKGLIMANRSMPKKLKILIAGCGTVAAEALALAYPEAEVIYAVDISNRVIEVAESRLLKRNIKTVQFVKTDIQDENFLKLFPESYFDFIHCTGVLHHLEKPGIAISNLSHILNPDGLIRFQVYSKGARIFIDWARQCFLQNKATSTSDVRQILVALSKYHPFRFVLSTYPESVTEPGLLDGFLNPQVKMLFAEEWFDYFNQSGLNILSLENLHYLDNVDSLFTGQTLDNFNSLSLAQKVTIFEKIGEWRSDFKGYLTKQVQSIQKSCSDKQSNNIIVDNIDNYSFPRLQLWHNVKSALKSIDFNPENSNFEKFLFGLSNREWLPGVKGAYCRMYWVAHRSECKMLSTTKYILELNKQNLIEDYIDNDTQIFIPSPENWPFEQWENGFFAWKWDYIN